MVNSEGKCISCDPEYYLLDTCFPVPEAQRITNCKLYKMKDNVLLCDQCLEKYFIKDSRCIQVETYIENCEISLLDTCQKCLDGHLLALDQKSCVKNLENQNCLNFSFFKCKECQASYSHFPNKPIQDVMSLVTSNEFQGYSRDLQYLSVCGVLPDNCTDFDSLGVCRACGAGYFLNNLKQCEENPRESISFCRDYSELEVCARCVQNYYLDDNQCLLGPSNLRDRCETLTKNGSNISCSTCLPDFVLQDGECVAREDILNCQAYKTNQNDCEQCAQGFQKAQNATTQKFLCVALLTNCLSQNFDNAGVAVECEQCVQGMFPSAEDGKICKQPQEISNCKWYNQNRSCRECNSGFKLVSNNCVAREAEVPNCSVFELDSESCAQCDPGLQKYTVKNRCVLKPTSQQERRLVQSSITHCLLDDGGICLYCDEGYSLSED
jgi:hypothetical protein